MSSNTNKKKAATPWWFWVFAGLMVLLNVLGMVQLVDPYLLSEAEKEELVSPVGLEIMKAEPFWATVGYSLGVIGSFLGSVTMLRHRTRRLSRIFFAVSILGLLTQRAWFFLLSGLTHLVPMPVMLLNPVVAALIAIWMVSRALRIAEQPRTTVVTNVHQAFLAFTIVACSIAFTSQVLAQTPPPIATSVIDVQGISTRYHAVSLDKRVDNAPAVIFINGSMASLEVWRGVFDRMDSKIPRLAYDRPGAGRSSAVEGKLTPERANAHLLALLKQLNISPPFVLVSWSWGGPLALDFASRYPGTVVGNIFLDPTLIGLGPIVDRARLIRLGASPKDLDAADARDKLESREMLAALPPGPRSELEAIFGMADDLVLQYPRVPTTVLLAGRFDQGFTRGGLPPGVDEAAYFRADRADTWQVLESRLRGVPGAVLRVLPKSSHRIPVEEPDAVAEEIQRILGLVSRR